MGNWIESDRLPRLRLLPSWHALKVLASNMSGRNSPVAMSAGKTQIAGIKRQTYTMPPPEADKVSYLQGGASNGRCIVFVHGTPGNARGWSDYLIEVPKRRRHIALDRLGYGLSSPRRAIVSLKRQARAVTPFLIPANGKKPIVVGHSSGAAVAVQTALDFPHAVGGLLLLAGALDPNLEEAIWIQALGMLKPISRLLPRNIDTANRELLGLKSELLEQTGRLHQIRIPVGVVHGEMDPLVSPANTDYLQRKLTNASIESVMLKHADHFIPWRCKQAIDSALDNLVDRVRRTEP